MSIHAAALALSNAAAKGSFAFRMAEIRERMEKLNELVNDHLGYNPDEINWGHVGSAAHLAGQLNAILAAFDNKD
jgi:hypothetical protein